LAKPEAAKADAPAPADSANQDVAQVTAGAH
jgi:hypothetical protein